MGEAEWLGPTDPFRLLGLATRVRWQHPNDRRLRLLGAACVRASRGPFEDPRVEEAVGLVEAFADGRTNADRALIKQARRIARDLFRADHPIVGANHIDPPTAGYYLLDPLVMVYARDAAEVALDRCRRSDVAAGRDPERGNEVRRRLIRCVYPSPFRQMKFKPRWRTPDAVGVAAGIYADRRFERMGILVDALIDGGCDSEDVLGHGRAVVHTRGCWLLDAVLGRR